MSRAVAIASLSYLVVVLLAVWPTGAAAQAVDPVFQRAQQMVTAGQDSAGRAVIDSVLAATSEGTLLHAEALFWRARFSRTAAGAERDYRRISVEYPLSPRASESLLLLAQLEMTRGDRASARGHLARLLREHPTSAVSTRASVTLARLAFDDGDVRAGCAAVAAAREGLATTDVELRNQIDYVGQRCANVAAVEPAPPSPPAAGDTTGKAATATTNATASPREFTVQVAAYDTRASADALAKRLTARGHAARVVGESRPYRVRVGRYPTRERAVEALRQMGASVGRGVVVQAEPR